MVSGPAAGIAECAAPATTRSPRFSRRGQVDWKVGRVRHVGLGRYFLLHHALCMLPGTALQNPYWYPYCCLSATRAQLLRRSRFRYPATAIAHEARDEARPCKHHLWIQVLLHPQIENQRHLDAMDKAVPTLGILAHEPPSATSHLVLACCAAQLHHLHHATLPGLQQPRLCP